MVSGTEFCINLLQEHCIATLHLWGLIQKMKGFLKEKNVLKFANSPIHCITVLSKGNIPEDNHSLAEDVYQNELFKNQMLGECTQRGHMCDHKRNTSRVLLAFPSFKI